MFNHVFPELRNFKWQVISVGGKIAFNKLVKCDILLNKVLLWWNGLFSFIQHCLISNRKGIHIVRKGTPRFTKSPSLVLIRLVLTETQRFKNVKINKEVYGHPDAVFGQRPDGHTFLCTVWHFQVPVSCLLLGLFTPNVRIMYSLVFNSIQFQFISTLYLKKYSQSPPTNSKG